MLSSWSALLHSTHTLHNYTIYIRNAAATGAYTVGLTWHVVITHSYLLMFMLTLIPYSTYCICDGMLGVRARVYLILYQNVNEPAARVVHAKVARRTTTPANGTSIMQRRKIYESMITQRFVFICRSHRKNRMRP